MTPPTDRPSHVPSQDTQTFNNLRGEKPALAPANGETVAPSAAATKSVDSQLRPMLAGYDILEELGRGGMGVVYKARQQGLGRLVALKMILHADHASTEDRQRFQREAESLAQLRHENIVQVHEVGEHDGKPFMCLEYVDGGGLDRRLGGTPLPPRQAAALVEKLAAAMQTAHAAGIVHRDLKPANVLLAGEPAASAAGSVAGEPVALAAGLGQPKITDFGLAKKQDAAGLSASGAIMGTPSYMAPEQAQGKGKEIDARADVYAVGAILYECLTGRPPFRAATVLDTLMQVIAEEPVPPCQLNPGVPRDLETICLKCLRKDLAQRYDSAEALAEDLSRFQRGEPVQARPVSRIERVWRWTRRNPMVASLLALVLLLMGLGTGIAWVLAVRAENEAGRAREQMDRADGEAKEAKAARAEEEKQRKAAEKARDDEMAAREQADRNLYYSRIEMAKREWEAGNVQNARDHLDATPKKMRHWEYGYLYGLAYNFEQTFLEHTGYVRSVAVTADGKRLVSGSTDRTVKVWDAHTGQAVLTLKGHTDAVKCVAVMADGTRLFSGGWDNTVKVWNARTGQVALTLKGHTGPVNGLAVTADGKHLFSGSTDKTVKVWDAHTGQEIRSLKGHTGPVNGLTVTADGKQLVSGSDDKTVKVWDTQTGQVVRTIQGHTGEVNDVAVTADGTHIVSGSTDTTVKMWDARTGQEVRTLKGHTSIVLSVAVTADGRRIVSGSYDNMVKVWDAQTGQETLNLKGHTGWVFSVAVTADGKRVVSGSRDQTMKVWDAHTGPEVLTLKGHTGSVMSVAVTTDGRRIVSGGGDRAVKVWDALTGQETLTLRGLTGLVLSVAVTADGKRLVSGSTDRTVKVWDAHTGQVALTLKGHKSEVNSVAVTADGRRIVSGSEDKTVKVWDAQTGQEILTFAGHTRSVHSVAVTADGKRIVSGGGDRTVQVWDAQTGQVAFTLKGHAVAILSVAVTADGRHIVSGSMDTTVKVWDAQSGQQTLTLKGHTAPVTSVAVTADGRRLVSGSVDETVKVWDAQTGQETLHLKGHSGQVLSVAVTADGTRLVSGSSSRTLQLWDAQTSQEALTLKGHTSEVRSAAVTADGKRIESTDFSGVTLVWDAATGQRLLNEKPTGGVHGQLLPDGSRLVLADNTLIRIYKPDHELAVRRRLRLTCLAQPDPSWHAEQAASAEASEDWFAAAFHLRRLSEMQPWDTALRIRLAQCQLGLDRPADAVESLLQALTLTPNVSLWPAAPAAAANALKAAKQNDWSRAAFWAERAARQPSAQPIDPILAALAGGRHNEAARRWRSLVALWQNGTYIQKSSLVFVGRLLMLPEDDARKLVGLATELFDQRKDASTLDYLGSAHYRAGNFAQAAHTLNESIKLQGRGGNVDTRLFLAMTRQRLGQHAEARRLFDSFTNLLKAQDFKNWQMEVRWRRLHEEAKLLILTMPRAEN